MQVLFKLKKHIQYISFSSLKYSFLIFFCLSASAKQPVVASYYVAAGNPLAVSRLPAEKLSHVIYAFIALCGNNTGANDTTQKAIRIACQGKEPYSAVIFNEKAVMSELAAFKQLKQQQSHLRILPSFGGWTLSQPFHGMAKSESARQQFVQSAVALIEKHDVFDGIDIDWEYPGGGGNSQTILSGAQAQREKQVFALLMQELRAELDKLKQNTGRDYQLTAAVSGSKAKTLAIDWQKTIPFMDYVFTMTYDFAVGDGRAGHHTNLFSSDENSLSAKGMINNLINAGVPAHKLVLGIAFYGRGWNNSNWKNNAFEGSNDAVSTGSYVYKELAANLPTGYQYGYDSEAEAAYLFNADTKGFISFDDPRSTRAKTDWSRIKGLAGVFSWQIMQDNGDLLNVMYDGMHSINNNDARTNIIETKN
jgi:GH18 family chitinase